MILRISYILTSFLFLYNLYLIMESREWILSITNSTTNAIHIPETRNAVYWFLDGMFLFAVVYILAIIIRLGIDYLRESYREKSKELVN